MTVAFRLFRRLLAGTSLTMFKGSVLECNVGEHVHSAELDQLWVDLNIYKYIYFNMGVTFSTIVSTEIN